jgi:hypothetical protein
MVEMKVVMMVEPMVDTRVAWMVDYLGLLDD